MTKPPLNEWLRQALDHVPNDEALFVRALTHGSHGDDDYERLEFLGDRVLGLVTADWLYRHYKNEPEGKLSRRLNAIVARETCADVARDIGVAPYVRLGKQARDDGAIESDNVLGDVLEALIGALWIDGGLEPARAFILNAWEERVTGQHQAPKHPKSALQEWAAAHGFRPPVYELEGRSGPHHAPRFTVRVQVPGKESASAEGASKQEAETAAAAALMDKLA
jgi:ribonuclease-3